MVAMDRAYPYNAQDEVNDAAWHEIFGDSGVIAGVGGELLITPGVGRAVDVAAGRAKSLGVVGVDDGAKTISLAANTDPTNQRLDAIVVRNTFASKTMEIVAKQGNPASSPVAPGLQQDASIHEILLGWVGLNAGYTGLTSGNVFNLRRLIQPSGGPYIYDSALARDEWEVPTVGMTVALRAEQRVDMWIGSAWAPIAGKLPYVAAANPATQTFTAGVSTPLLFNSEVDDADGLYNLATGVFTAPIAGVYAVDWSTVHLDTDNVYVAHQLTWSVHTFTKDRFIPLALAGGGGELVVVSSSYAVRVAAGGTITPKAAFSITRSATTRANALSISYMHA